MYKQRIVSALYLSVFELWCLILVTTGFVLAGIAKPLLQRLDLIGTTNIVQAQIGNTLQSSLHSLDNLEGSASFVTFLTWAIVGLIVVSILQAAARASGLIQLERDVSSNRYVHPQGFTRRRFWSTILTDTLISVTLVTVFLLTIFVSIAVVIPTSLGFLQLFTAGGAKQDALNAAMGLLALLADITIIYSLIKLLIWRYRVDNP